MGRKKGFPKFPPEWLFARYMKLWRTFQSKEFTLSQAEEVLKGDKVKVTHSIAKMSRSDLLTIKVDKDDKRKRRYTLKEPTPFFSEIMKKF